MATYSELKGRVQRLVDDTLEDQVYADELYLDAIQNAFMAILPWVPKTGKATLTADGSKVEFDIPVDLFEVEAVIDSSDGQVLPKGQLVPGKYFGDSNQGAATWVLFPNGKITFSEAPSEDIVLYYLASWTLPTITSGNGAMEPPDYATTGITLYAAAHVILPTGVSITELRQFNTRIDSGNPEHNPVQKAADYLLKLFLSEMNRLPRYQKVAT